MTTHARVTPEEAAHICNLLLKGMSTTDVGIKYGRSRQWVGLAARQAGLVFDGSARDGKWTKPQQETTNVTDGTWNMSVDDYNALLTPEREQTNTNGHAAAPEQIVGSIDADIQEALNLLAQAEQQRKTDLSRIAELERQRTDEREHNRTAVKDLRGQIETLGRKVDQLEVENKRLMDKLKGEISRGLLRQGMDSLRKVL